MQREIQNLESRLGSQGSPVSNATREVLALDDDTFLDAVCDNTPPGAPARNDETNPPESSPIYAASSTTASPLSEMMSQKEKTAAVFLSYARTY